MSNGTSNQQNWSSTQAYVLAAICLLLGVAVGYLLRGSDTVAQPQAAAVQEQAPPPAGAQPSPADLKRMADTQAAPLLQQLQGDPNNPDLLANIGNIYYGNRQFKTATPTAHSRNSIRR